MKAFLTLLLAALIGSSVSGCSTMDPEINLFGGGRVTTASADQMFDADFEGFSDERLFRLLDPDNKVNLSGKFSDLSESQQIEYLRKAFWVANTNPDYGTKLRNQIQDRLIAASNQRCNLYTTYLKRVSTFTNGIFGTLTTILGGAGAIVTGATASRVLSGVGGITSGTRAELNQAIFESVATSVIVPGIQLKRQNLLGEFAQKRDNDIQKYTVEAAIADAITYHGACSLDAGVAQANKSIQNYDDIGIKRLIEVQEQLGLARAASESFATGPIRSVVAAGKVLDEFTSKLGGYKIRAGSLKPSPTDLLTNIQNLETQSVPDWDTKAKSLDSNLSTLLFDYVSARGAEKTAKFKLLEAQQIDARRFKDDLDAEDAKIANELQKLETAEKPKTP